MKNKNPQNEHTFAWIHHRQTILDDIDFIHIQRTLLRCLIHLDANLLFALKGEFGQIGLQREVIDHGSDRAGQPLKWFLGRHRATA